MSANAQARENRQCPKAPERPESSATVPRLNPSIRSNVIDPSPVIPPPIGSFTHSFL